MQDIASRNHLQVVVMQLRQSPCFRRFLGSCAAAALSAAPLFAPMSSLDARVDHAQITASSPAVKNTGLASDGHSTDRTT